MNKESVILVLGSNGLVGSSLIRILEKKNYTNILAHSRNDADLLCQRSVYEYFEKHKPEYVFFAAAKVGGIKANNTYRADFIFENLGIQQNVIGAAYKNKVTKLLFLGSSCIYPKNSPQPIKEEYLLTSPLEPTNEPYAVAKIAGLKMCESFMHQYGCNYISVMPTNLYGEYDNFDLENSHVIPGLIARMQKAKNNGDKRFTAWGTGTPRREFLYIDDMAEACIHVMNHKGKIPSLLNIGSGTDVTIKELVLLIKDKIGFEGDIIFDSSKPDGTLKKLMDVSKINQLGWKASTSLSDGLDKSIKFYKDHYK